VCGGRGVGLCDATEQVRPPPRHNDHNQNHGVTEIHLVRVEIDADSNTYYAADEQVLDGVSEDDPGVSDATTERDLCSQLAPQRCVVLPASGQDCVIVFRVSC
jgi:hypothetical protein